jgi:tetratricopeptide (TPR) repeat protein
MNMSKKLSIISLLVLLSGCSLWDNFVTYFNTFYNAERDYNQAIELINESKPDPFEFKFDKVPNGTNKLFNNVVKNLSDILQHHPKSKYAEPSLLILGKVFYYQKNFPKAERKFKELASKGDTDLYLENLLWLAKTELQMRKFDDGLKALQVVKQKASEEENLELLTDAFITEIAFYVFRENYDNAISDGKAIYNVTDNNEIKALLAYEIGKLYKKLEKYDEASIWFAKVLDYSPDFETEFRSKLEYAKMQLELGEYDKSEELLLSLKDDDKFNDYQDEIEEELGKLYFKMGEIGEAIYQFTLVDSLYKAKQTGGEAKYMLGNIMDNIYHNYDSAYTYYQGVGKTKAEDKLKLISRKRLNILDIYFKTSKDQKVYFKQYLYATNPEAFKKDSAAYQEYLLFNNKEKVNKDSLNKKDSLNVDKTKAENLTIEERMALFKKKEREDAKKMIEPKRPKLSADSLKSLLSETYLKKGNLFFSELDVLDSAFFYYSKIIDDFDSTRYDPNAYYNLGAYYLTVADTIKGDSLFKYVVKKYPFSPLAESAAKKLGIIREVTNSDPAQKEYFKAEAKMDSLRYREALNILINIPSNFPKSPIVPQSFYTVGWIYENILFNPDSAYAYYKKVTTDYKTTEYARAANPKVKAWENKIREEERKIKARQDSIKLAAKKDSLRKLIKTDSLKSSKPVAVKDSIQTEKQQINSIPQSKSPAKAIKKKINTLPKVDTLKNKKKSGSK